MLRKHLFTSVIRKCRRTNKNQGVNFIIQVADLTAEVDRLKAELDRSEARVAYEKERNKSKTSEISRESGQKRKTSATSNSFAARDQPECSYIDDQCTNEDTPENQAVSFLSAKRGEGKRFVKQKIH